MIQHRLDALKREDHRQAPPDRSEIRDLQAQLPLGEAAAERTAERIVRSAIPKEERRRKNEVRALNAIRRILEALPSADPKIEALLGEIHAVLEHDPTEKLIVFTEYLDTLEAIKGRLDPEPSLAGRYVVLHGGLGLKRRLQRQAAFEESGTRVLLATDAASEGLNLQRHCRRVIHFELPSNPNRLEQRNGRVDRYGQTRNPEIRYLYAPDSLEDDVLNTLVGKIERMRNDRLSTPDILGVLVGDGEVEKALVDLDPEAADIVARNLPEGNDSDDEEGGESAGPARQGRGRRREDADERLERVAVCLGCGKLVGEGQECLLCGRPSVPVLLHRGRLNKCPACGDIYTRGDIVTPLRTGTASTVSVLTAHHLDPFEGQDRKLLVFADKRQDAAHQAGYTAGKHRSFALRHLIAHDVQKAGTRDVYLSELPERLFDHYRELGIIPRRWTKPERERWMWVLEYEAASELTRCSRQRGSLENLGLVAVEYEFLEHVEANADFQAAARLAGLDLPVAVMLVRAILDVMRKNRAVAYEFFQEYVDPNQKRKFPRT